MGTRSGNCGKEGRRSPHLGLPTGRSRQTCRGPAAAERNSGRPAAAHERTLSSLIPAGTARRDHARSREDRSVDSASQADWAGADSPITIQVELGRKLKGYAHRNPVTQSILNLNHESQSRSQSQSRPQSQSRTVTNPCHDHRYYHLPYSDSVAIIASLPCASLSRITNHIQTQSPSHEHRRNHSRSPDYNQTPISKAIRLGDSQSG